MHKRISSSSSVTLNQQMRRNTATAGVQNISQQGTSSSATSTSVANQMPHQNCSSDAANQLLLQRNAATEASPNRNVPASGISARSVPAPRDVQPDAQVHPNLQPRSISATLSRPIGLICAICGQHFLILSKLYEHIQTCAGLKRFKCKKCHTRDLSKRQLKEHMEILHNEPRSGSEMAMPIVDVSRPRTVKRIKYLGASHIVPVSDGQPGTAVPILRMDRARSAEQALLSNLRACAIFELGSLKSLEDQ